MIKSKIKFKVETALLQVNQISEALVEELRVDEGKTIVCQLSQPKMAVCPGCSQISRSVKNRYPRVLVGIGLLGWKFEVHLTTIHFTCRNEFCPKKTFAPDLGIADGKSPYLPALKEYLAKEHFLAKKNNLETAAETHSRWQVSISEATLRRIQNQVEIRPFKLKVRRLGLDEIYPKGIKPRGSYLAMFDLDKGILLGMTKGICQKDLKKLWEKVETKGVDLSGVSLIVRDLYPHWDGVIKEKVGKNQFKPEVTVLADPFHLIKRVQTLLYRQYYAPLRKRLRAEGKTRESLDLFYARWAFRKGSEKLTPKQSCRLTKILNLYPRLDQAWILKEKTRYIYQARNRSEARERLAWVIDYSKRKGFLKAAKTLIRNQTGILSFFKRNEDEGKREVRHYPEERISQIRRVERRRGSFRKAETLERNMLIGYQLAGLI